MLAWLFSSQTGTAFLCGQSTLTVRLNFFKYNQMASPTNLAFTGVLDRWRAYNTTVNGSDSVTLYN